jgi:NADPH:quinone reductase-like Zn-dependent oxidoreductase
MKIMRLADALGGPALVEATAPKPKLGPGELLIQVRAAGITTTEPLWYPSSHTKTGEKRVGAVPSHEFSGVIAEAGIDAGGLKVGQEVFGMNDWFADGALAEYCVTTSSSVAYKPRSLTHVEAAATPIGALTAWQGLFDRAKLQSGESVLVHGGAGSVGVFAIQLARFQGAHVIATASARNRDFVASLGANQVLDYQTSKFEESVPKVDVVFDTVGGETLSRSWGVLKSSGRMVTVAASSEAATEERVKNAFFIVEANQKQLIHIGELIDAGRLKPVVDSEIQMSQVPEAFEGRLRRRGRGKLVVSIAA